MACTADHHKYMENFMESKTSQCQIRFFQSIYNSANCISQTSCQKRVEAETAETLQVIHSAHGRQNHLYDEIKDDADADHDGNIIVG